MKKYKVVMGYYPSFNSAQKVLAHANSKLKALKLKVKEGRIVNEQDCFIVVLYETDDYDDADNIFSECMKNKIYCGIDISGNKNV